MRTLAMRKLVLSLLATAVGACAFLTTTSSRAEDIAITGPLAGAPATRHLRKYRAGRFEIAPEVSFTLLDEFRRAIMPGLHAMYNFTDWLAVAAFFDYGLINSTTDLTDQIDAQSPRNSRTAYNVSPKVGGFADQVAKMQYAAAGELQFTPFRGKLALFQKIFIDADLYAHGGLAFIGLQERGDCGTAGTKPCAEPSTFALQSRTALAPVFGLGLKFYGWKFFSFGVEYRALPFSWNRPGFDQRGGGTNGNFPNTPTPVIDSADRTFKFNQTITLGFGFSFPTEPSISE